MAQRKNPNSTELTRQALTFAEFAAQCLVSAGQLAIKDKEVAEFPLDAAERAVVAELPELPVTLKTKLAKAGATFTLRDAASIVLTVAESLHESKPRQRLKLLNIAEKLTDCVQNIVLPALFWAKASMSPKSIYQFKITLLHTEPPVWRQIQVQDCTLDTLHEYIQTAMGWTNSHLHQFHIRGQCYGNPDLLDEGVEDIEWVDSTKTSLSSILPKTGKRFSFQYEYDFGDGWEHEIVFEGRPPVDPNANYPLCLNGARACPPEDCGGVWGYADFVNAIRDKKHAAHKEMLNWFGGPFDPEAFDAAATSQAMKMTYPE